MQNQRGARKREAAGGLQNSSESMEVENECKRGNATQTLQRESSLMRQANFEGVAEATRLSMQNE